MQAEQEDGRSIPEAEAAQRAIALGGAFDGHDLPADIRMTIDLQSTWQLEDKKALFADFVEDNNGRVGDPDWTGQLNFRFSRGDWTGFWGIDMVGKASDAEFFDDRNAAGTTFYKIHTEFTAYHSLSLQKRFEDWSLVGGVANLFNELPPQVTMAQGDYNMVGRSVLSSQYDYIGRRVFLSMQAKF